MRTGALNFHTVLVLRWPADDPEQDEFGVGWIDWDAPYSPGARGPSRTPWDTTPGFENGCPPSLIYNEKMIG